MKRNWKTGAVASAALATGLSLAIAGCSTLGDGENSSSISKGWNKLFSSKKSVDAAAKKDANTERVVTSPARTVRFDGHEIVLGNGEVVSISNDSLMAKCSELIQAGRYRSALMVAGMHCETAERVLLERWAQPSSQNESMLILADALALKNGAGPQNGWRSLLQFASQQPQVSQAYVEARNSFAEKLQDQDPSPEETKELQRLAEQINHPLVQVDVARLLGLRELLADRSANALQHYQRGIEVADAYQIYDKSADLWLLASEANRRNNDFAGAEQAWREAVTRGARVASNVQPPIDPTFWERADHLRPPQANWPIEVANVLATRTAKIGFLPDKNQPQAVDSVLWAAIGLAQFERGQPELALMNYKKAERMTGKDDALVLRIAQARALAALGQVPAATAILSGPASSQNPQISAPAVATLGTIKVQAGAYQQGATLLGKALFTVGAENWATRADAQADMAIALLIIGQTEQGTKLLHEAQSKFEQKMDYASLLRSLENEAKLMEHEKHGEEARKIRERMVAIEQFR